MSEPERGPNWPFPTGSRQYPSLAARLADPEIHAGRIQALQNCANGIGVFAGHRQVEPDTSISAEMVERACRAHWSSFDRMRPDHAAEKRVKMQAALAAALYGGRLKP